MAGHSTHTAITAPVPTQAVMNTRSSVQDVWYNASTNSSQMYNETKIRVWSALDDFCGSPLWDYHLSIATPHPDVTSCFRSTILVWIPCGLIILTFLPHLIYLRRTRGPTIQHSWLNVTKTILGVSLIILAAVDLVSDILTAQSSHVSILAALLRVAAMTFSTILIQLDRLNGRRTSYILAFYWFLMSVSSAIILHSAILRQTYKNATLLFATLCIHCTFVGVQFVLSMLVDKRPPGYTETSENPCPYFDATVISRFTFWWSFRLMLKGFRTPLENKEMWEIRPDLDCRNVIKPLLSRWTVEMNKMKRSREKAATAVPDQEIPLKSAEEGIHVAPSAKIYNPSFFLTIIRAYWFNYIVSVLLKVLQEVIMFSSPYVLKLLLGFVADPDEHVWKGYFYAAMMFVLAIAQCLVQQHYNFVHLLTGGKIRAALMSLIYRKALKLSHAARTESTVGEIVNLMSVDSQRFMELTHFLNMVWSAPLQVALAMYFLHGLLQNAVFAGFGVILFFIPFNGIIVRINKKLQMKHMKQKDARMKMMNEILNGIKVLKLYAWEGSFEKKILEIRNQELGTLRKSVIVHCFAMILWVCSPFLVALASFGAYTKMYPDSRLDAQKIFVTVALINLLKIPLEQLPGLIASMVQVNVSVNRLAKYLKHEELDPDAVEKENTKDSVTIENGTFGWNKKDPALLKNIDLRIRDGSLVAIVGAVGAGKSSLLSAMLGEMEKFRGRVNVKGTVAYVAQQAWIQQATLKNNIIFHNPEKNDTYRQLIKDCALQADLDILPAGDGTEIGEKGINLSGGQKLRVSLARAVYHEADIYIMDDPLSAVDAHVGKHIFKNVIGPNGMLKGKTRILVTHGVGFLPHFDQIIVLVDGQVTETGSYQELLDKGGAFSEYLQNYYKEHQDEMEAEDGGEFGSKTSITSGSKRTHLDAKEKKLLQNGGPVLNGSVLRERSSSLGSTARRKTTNSDGQPKSLLIQRLMSVDNSFKRQVSRESDNNDRERSVSFSQLCTSQSSMYGSGDIDAVLQECQDINIDYEEEENKKEDEKKDGEDEEAGQLVDEEHAEKGNVKLTVYTTYFRTLGLHTALFILTMAAGHVGFGIGKSTWLSDWSDEETAVPSNSTIDSGLRNKRLIGFAFLGSLQGIAAAVQDLFGMMAGLKMSQVQHERLLRNILSCPMTFYDRTPIGRILNRFGKDVDALDNMLPRLFMPLMRMVMHLVGSLVVMAYVTPWSLLAWAIVSVFYILVQRLYVTSQRQLNRLLSINRSPIYANFSETLTGVSTIRAYKRQDLFIDNSMEKINTLHRAFFPLIVNNRWLGIVLETMGAFIILFCAAFAVASRGTLSAGTIGLVMSYALTITGTLNWVVRFVGQVETQIVSVERIKEYCEVKTEAPWEIPEHKPPPGWPEEGQVTFNDFSVRYREGLDLVLKGIQFSAKGGEKIGIVGRTGAGKSSLTLSLFRLIEAAGGAIYIDGINIGNLGLHDLRSKLTIIPQDPVLFSGTLRMNLDPFELHTDDEIWTALQHSHLDQFVSSLPDKLLQECSEGGENLSVGQRQLVCLARALLRKTKVLILDEATAAVDLETDDFIQSTIRTEFKECTVLTIAHRLNTIIDCDRVLVLDTGKIKELDSPQALLSDRSTTFYSLAKDAGLTDNNTK